ncbi:MAG: RHS repeat domain-containing protein, partial [Saprospiraceae bacterium]
KITKFTSANTGIETTQNYISGIEYNGAALEAVYHEEGRLVPNGTAWHYEYTLKDHLGNSRVMFRANGATAQLLQENHYYPFGMEMEGAWTTQVGTENKYQYNGKELVEDFGWNWYPYGARYYDAAVGRFWGVDPIADRFAHASVYNYAENEPVANIDLHGLQASRTIGKKEHENQKGEQGAKAEQNSQAAKEELAMTTVNGLLKTAQQVVQGLENAEDLGIRLGQYDLLMTISSLVSENQKQSTMTDIEIVKSNQRITGTVIGEGVALVNPILGLATSFLLNNATNDDGITNLSNGKMAEAYSTSFNDNVKGNFHLQRAIAAESQKSLKTKDNAASTYRKQHITYRLSQFL